MAASKANNAEAMERQPLLDSRERAQSKRMSFCDFMTIVLGLAGSLLLIVAAWRYFGGDQRIPPPDHHLYAPGTTRPHAPEDYHGALNYTKQETLELDPKAEPYRAIDQPVGIYERLTGYRCPPDWRVTGKVRLVHGHFSQRANFMVGLHAASSSRLALESFGWLSNGHDVYLDCHNPVADDPYAPGLDLNDTVRIDITVSIKPHTLQFGKFELDANKLDIAIAKGLVFENYNMLLHTTNGSIFGGEADTFAAHDISVRTTNGGIRGNWSLPASIDFLASGSWRRRDGVWQPDKGIDIDLIPKQWSWGPQTQGRLTAETGGGDIKIRTPVDDHLSLRNNSISVRSRTGSISGTFVTGSETTLITGGKGAINVTLLPYYQLPETAYLTTTTVNGNITVEVLPPKVNDFDKIDPLLNTRSEHTTVNGSLALRYPWEWAGTALGLSRTGSVSVSGSAWDTVMQKDHMVVAVKGDKLSSRLDFTTERGNGELIID